MLSAPPSAPLIERLILRRMIGQPVFAIIMITIGLLVHRRPGDHDRLGTTTRSRGRPVGLETVAVGACRPAHSDIWTIVLAAVVLSAFFVFFRY